MPFLPNAIRLGTVLLILVFLVTFLKHKTNAAFMGLSRFVSGTIYVAAAALAVLFYCLILTTNIRSESHNSHLKEWDTKCRHLPKTEKLGSGIAKGKIKSE